MDGEIRDIAPFVDDPSIPNGAMLWRRIPKSHFVPDGNRKGGIRPSTAAFEDDGDGSPMSAYLGDELTSPQIILEGHEGEGYAVWWFSAELARACDQKIVRSKVDGPGGDAHVFIVGNKKPRGSVRMKFVNADQTIPPQGGWAVEPP